MILSLILTLNLIGALPVENIVPAEQTVSEVYSVDQEEVSQEEEVSILSDEVSLADVKSAIDETNELLETIIGDRLTSMDENYKAVNERNLTEEDPEVQPVKGNKYELTMYQLQVVQNITLVLLLAINLCSIFIRRSRNG